MPETDFLNKLIEEKKLQLVEPSDPITRSYLEKSESNLISAKILLQNNRLEESVSLAYYSMYNILIALLFKVGIKCENHSGSIILLRDVFGIDNTSIREAKKERIDKQYYVDFSVTKKDVDDLIREAERFRAALRDFISKVNTSQKQKYREIFNKRTGA
jgi:uncharacterized protein (UPF0332 family)